VGETSVGEGFSQGNLAGCRLMGVLMYSREVIGSGVRGRKVILHQFGEIELLYKCTA
jgi:hypothetical protein